MATERLKTMTKTTGAKRRKRFVDTTPVQVSDRDFALIKKTIAKPAAPNEALQKLAKQYWRTIKPSP
ncbi:MAG: hypothetical protein JST84_08690 [Acidobacteria bacterium]|nr:hypothetical protein [Acidobacteriota bacterium]